MISAFQAGAFQTLGFQILATQTQASGGYGFGAWDEVAHRRKKLLEEIERLEEHIAEEREVPVEAVRVEVEKRLVVTPLPPRVKRVVRKAVDLPTLGALQHAETVLRRLQEQEEEEFAVLILALH